ncbi:hypothetical protein HDU82_008819 [Entophlyctis luteolus]|nr:hypothetical protein HDU82_008819 [Entophlyctis luteolus]
MYQIKPAYVKTVELRYTTDNWRTHNDVTASFVSSITGNSDSIMGLDQFDATIPVPTILERNMQSSCGTGGSSSVSDQQDFLAIELAARVKMNGIESWDNNSGRNHGTVVMRLVRSVSGLMSAATTAALIGTTSIGGRPIVCGTAFRTKEVIGAATRAAVKSAQAVAAEAEAIKRDFDLKWKNSKRKFSNDILQNPVCGSGNANNTGRITEEQKRELEKQKLVNTKMQEPSAVPFNHPMGCTFVDSACKVSESRVSYRFPRFRNIDCLEESHLQYQNNDSPLRGGFPVTNSSQRSTLRVCDNTSVDQDPKHQQHDVSQILRMSPSLSTTPTVFASWRTPSATTEHLAALFSLKARSKFEGERKEEGNMRKLRSSKMMPWGHDVDDLVVKSLAGWNCWDD